MNANKEGQGTLIWLVCWVADMLRTFEWTFQTFSDICHHNDRGGVRTFILHGDDVKVGWSYCLMMIMMILHCLFDFTLFGCKRDALALCPFQTTFSRWRESFLFSFCGKTFLVFSPSSELLDSSWKKENLAFYICELCPLHFVCVCARHYWKKMQLVSVYMRVSLV